MLLCKFVFEQSVFTYILENLHLENNIMYICKSWQELISWVQKAVVEVGEGGGVGNMVRWAISLERVSKASQVSDVTDSPTCGFK